MKPATFRRIINFWPPFLFSGIRATRILPDYSEVDVSLRLRWFNRSMMGTQFGGSLFAMADAWYVLMLTHRLGRDYQVWDKQAAIEFIRPARGDVHARFRLAEAQLEQIRLATATGDKHLPQFEVDIVDDQGTVVARVSKTLYVRQRQGTRAEASASSA